MFVCLFAVLGVGRLTALDWGRTLKAQYTATPLFWLETKQSFEVRCKTLLLLLLLP